MEAKLQRQQRSLATRNLILDCAEIEFFRASIARTTLDGIASASGMTRGAIYGHFDNKHRLLSAIFDRSAISLDPFTIPELGPVPCCLDALRQGLFACMRDVLLDGRKRRLYSIAHSASITEPECLLFGDTVRDAGELARLRIRYALERATIAGEIHVDDCPDSAAVHIHACLTGYFLLSLRKSPPQSPEQNAVRVVAYALSPLDRSIRNGSPQ
ncbi:TetR family transcriptional regulator [Paraburkholderia phytofirmans]|uniref:TetR family transcriptional regulator n=1 Tax=Paraburkholderia phytofirmans TaxID=261302 RepID=UPI0038BB01FF